MAKSRKDSVPIEAILQLLQKVPPQYLALLLVLVLLGGAIVWVGSGSRPEQPPLPPGEPGTYSFCTWNVGNFFDDEDNPKENDNEENFFGTHPEMFNVKVDRLSDALLKMNGYLGPDIVALQEVESERAMQALMNRLNEKLEKVGKPDAKYTNILFVEDRTGRGFAPAILTRLPVVRDRTRHLGHGAMRRILEGHIQVNGHQLVVIAAHWTSRVTDKDAEGTKRQIYADACHGRFREMFTTNPDVDVIVCGDFNDTIDDPSVRDRLFAGRDEQAVIQSLDVPRLFDLSGRFDGTTDPKGTIAYKHHWSVFDHICISRGLFDARGWTCDPSKTAIFAPEEMRTKNGEPFAFGGPNAKGVRGYSDHFPVVTQLRVQGNAAE